MDFGFSREPTEREGVGVVPTEREGVGVVLICEAGMAESVISLPLVVVILSLSECCEMRWGFCLSPQPGNTIDIRPPLLSKPKETGLQGRTSPSTPSQHLSRSSSRFQAWRQERSSRTISTMVRGSSSLRFSVLVWLATPWPMTSRALSCSLLGVSIPAPGRLAAWERDLTGREARLDGGWPRPPGVKPEPVCVQMCEHACTCIHACLNYQYYTTSFTCSKVSSSIEICLEGINLFYRSSLLWYVFWHFLNLTQPHDECLRIKEKHLNERVITANIQATHL